MWYPVLFIFIIVPAYVVRFKFLGYPANFLMVAVFLFWIVFATYLLIKKQLPNFFLFLKQLDKKAVTFSLLFFLAGVISLFVRGFDRAKLGQFIVIFLQPISIFFMAGFIFKKNPESKNSLLVTCYSLLVLAGLYAIFQYFTLLGLPPAWWGNSVEPKRALSFFVHPNFYALWCAPLLALLLPDLGLRIKDLKRNWLVILFWLIGSVGLLLSLSRSGWLGLAAAVVVYAIVAADKKIRKIIFGAVVIMAIIVVLVPNLRWRVILPFYGEKSADSRIELWADGLTAIKQSPVLGLGLTGFAREYSEINSDPTLDPHNFPHNIFLDLWVETGLLGLISFVALAVVYIYSGLKDRQNIFKLGVALFLIAILFQGLVDNPYFKNDLAMVFWIVLTLAL